MEPIIFHASDFTKTGFKLLKENESEICLNFCDGNPVQYLYLYYSKDDRSVCIKSDTNLYGEYRFLVNRYRIDGNDDIDTLLNSLIFNGRTIQQHINFFK